MIAFPLTDSELSTLAGQIIIRFPAIDATEDHREVMTRLITIMRIHTSSLRAAEWIAMSLQAFHLGRPTDRKSHELQQELLNVASNIASESGGLNIFQKSACAEMYARLLIELAPSLEDDFLCKQLGSIIFLASDRCDMALFVADLVYRQQTPVIRFPAETRDKLALYCEKHASKNVEIDLASMFIQRIREACQLFAITNIPHRA